MVGIVVVTHGRIGVELCSCAEEIMGAQEGLAAVSVDFTKAVEDARSEVEGAIERVGQGDGVIVLTDMFGGTPSNISLSFLDNPKIEVVTGVNLPMVIKGMTLRKDRPLPELCQSLQEYGQRGIIVASHLLKERQGHVP